MSGRPDIQAVDETEAEMVGSLSAMLRSQGYRVRVEVSNMGQSVDLVATRGSWVTVIEAKLRNWRRALAQCQTHEQVADYICVAIGTAVVAPALLEGAASRGYGVLHYDRKNACFNWILRPRRNRLIWKPQRQHWSKG